VELGSVRQKSGKIVTAWTFQGNCDPAALVSNTFEMEWPPRSGQRRTFPEVDRAGFFSVNEAREKINVAEAEFLSRLETLLGGDGARMRAGSREPE
jgi:predicted NUDIX family NTP pyrophosphohydrolase